MLREEKRRYLLLSVILLLISMIATCSTVFLLYRAAVSERSDGLVTTAQSQARLIEAIARHDRKYAASIRKDFPDYVPEVTSLQQVIEAQRNSPGLGSTGEFVLARRSAGQIVYLLVPHQKRQDVPPPVAFHSALAEPMRRALSGLSGAMIGPDYNGETVLAAYEPVAELDLGIVVKVDMAEVRSPFIQAAGLALLISSVLFLSGALLLKHVLSPLFKSLRGTSDELMMEMRKHQTSIEALRESEERFRQIADVAQDAFWLVDCSIPDSPSMLYINKAFEQLWRKTAAEIMENSFLWAEYIHPIDRKAIVADYLSFLRDEGPFDHEFRILSPAGDIHHVLARGNLIRDSHGRIIRAAVIAHDITPIKEAEQMVQQANLDLEIKISERTEELNRTIRLMSGREERMAQLKSEVQQLKEQLQQREVAQ